MAKEHKGWVMPKKELYMFAIGAGGQGMVYAMMSSYVSDYYVNVLQLPLVFVLLLMLLARVWDAIESGLPIPGGMERVESLSERRSFLEEELGADPVASRIARTNGTV